MPRDTRHTIAAVQLWLKSLESEPLCRTNSVRTCRDPMLSYLLFLNWRNRLDRRPVEVQLDTRYRVLDSVMRCAS